MTTLVAEIAENYYRLMALDKRLENINQIIELQQRSLEIAQARKDEARSTQLGVLRFQAEVKRNQSELLIINQGIIERENRINFLVNRYPQRVERMSADFYDLTIHPLSVGFPRSCSRTDPTSARPSASWWRRARREGRPGQLLPAAGHHRRRRPPVVQPSPTCSSRKPWLGDIAGGLVAPFVNKRAIRAQYLTANARQLQSIYNYQRVILEAFTQVVNRVTMVENYSKSIEIKKQQLKTLESAAVQSANDLFQNARIEYIDVLFAQRDLRDARTVLIDTKTEQLSAIVNAYQALGGGVVSIATPPDFQRPVPLRPHGPRG